MSDGGGGRERGEASVWAAPFDRALRSLVAEVRVLSAVTPTNSAHERARLTDLFARGRIALPAWSYRRTDMSATRRALARMAEVLDHETGSLAALYRRRVDELDREAAVVEAVGTPTLPSAAGARFATEDEPAVNALADELARAPDDPLDAAPAVAADADDPRSLVARLRALVGDTRVPFRIEVRDDLLAAAATGEDTIYVARGRALTARASERIALHEVHGHAAPRTRARGHAVGIFAIGTAGGTDDQEGYALVLEARAGHLSGARARELAARQATVRRMRAGADFAEATAALMVDGLDATQAVRIAERAYRGSDGRTPGLGREAVYLSAFLRVRRALDACEDDERVLASGQVSVDALAILRGLVPH